MNYELAALWGQVVFGAAAVFLIGAWFLTGKKSATLRIGGGVSILIASAAAIYTNYVV